MRHHTLLLISCQQRSQSVLLYNALFESMFLARGQRKPLGLVLNISLLAYAASSSPTPSATASATSTASATIQVPVERPSSSSSNMNPADSLIANQRSKIKTIVSAEAKTASKTHTKLVHFIRHAEGEHNVAGEANYINYLKMDYQDAQLSSLGVEQCTSLSRKIDKKFPLLDEEVNLLVVSPLLRTLQTASFVFPHLIKKVDWIALDCIREQTGLHPCDQRKDISFRSKSYPSIDFSQIVEDSDQLYNKYTITRGTVHHHACIYTYTYISQPIISSHI